MKRLVLSFVVLMVFMGIAYAENREQKKEPIQLASISSQENLLGINSSMGSVGAGGSGPATDALLMETGDFVLLETGEYLLLE